MLVVGLARRWLRPGAGLAGRLLRLVLGFTRCLLKLVWRRHVYDNLLRRLIRLHSHLHATTQSQLSGTDAFERSTARQLTHTTLCGTTSGNSKAALRHLLVASKGRRSSSKPCDWQLNNCLPMTARCTLPADYHAAVDEVQTLRRSRGLRVRG